MGLRSTVSVLALVGSMLTVSCTGHNIRDLTSLPREKMASSLFSVPKAELDACLPIAAARTPLDVKEAPKPGAEVWVLGRGMGLSSPGFWVRVDTVAEPAGTRVFFRSLVDDKHITWTLEEEAAQAEFLAELTAVAYERGAWK